MRRQTLPQTGLNSGCLYPFWSPVYSTCPRAPCPMSSTLKQGRQGLLSTVWDHGLFSESQVQSFQHCLCLGNQDHKALTGLQPRSWCTLSREVQDPTEDQISSSGPSPLLAYNPRKCPALGIYLPTSTCSWALVWLLDAAHDLSYLRLAQPTEMTPLGTHCPWTTRATRSDVWVCLLSVLWSETPSSQLLGILVLSQVPQEPIVRVRVDNIITVLASSSPNCPG